MDEHSGSTIDWARVLDALPDAVSVVDSDHRLLWVNEAMARFVGLPAPEVVGRRCFDLLPYMPERIERCPCARLSEGRETEELEIPERGIRVRITVDPIRNADGTLFGAIHLIRDITREQRGEERYRDLSGRLSSLMNNIPGAVYRGLRDWSILLMGAEVERFTGYSPKEVTGGTVSWQTLVHPADLEWLKEVFRQAVRERKRILRVEYRILHRDGSVHWVSDRRQIFYDEAGEFVYVDGLLLDITERKLSQMQRSVADDKLRALIESSPLPIVALDPEGRVILWSRAAENAYGWMEEEVVGQVLPLVPEAERDEFRSLLARVVAGERIAGVERRRNRKDGTPVTISVSAAPWCDHDGVVTGVMSVAADVTERKAMEEALVRSEEQFRQSQKMEAVGRLAGGIAHDFNNLLTAIRGYSDLLLQKLEEEDPLRREVVEIQKAGERAASLTQQLLAFSRKQILEPKVLDLNEIVADMERMLRRLIGEDVDLVTVLRPDLWAVKADPGQIEQVILNLAVNARDAMPRGGTLSIETVNRTVGPGGSDRCPHADPGEYAVLAIGDTGQGMDEPTLARIFEPFFTTKEKGRGTGLGLATVYGIVKQSEGFIYPESRPGEGTLFRIYLPRCTEIPGPLPDHEPTRGEAPRGKETILLVEDDEVVRTLAEAILSGKGYAVLCAGNGLEGVEAADRHEGPIHLLLTDVVMPKMGGRDLAAELVQARGGLKVLFMTGYADRDFLEERDLPPGSKILRKPFRVDGLLRKVREILDR